MSELLTPHDAPARTRIIIRRSVKDAPELTRFLDTPGLLAAACYYAYSVRDRDQRCERLRELAPFSHRELQKHLGLPSLRIIRKLTRDALWESTLKALSTLTDDREAMRVLRHAPKLSSSLVFSLATPVIRTRVSTGFLAELSRAPEEKQPNRVALKTLAQFLDEYRPQKCITSITQYERLLDQNNEMLSTYWEGRCSDPKFPNPPFVGEPGFITPIATWQELIRESIEMSNCAATDSQLSQAIRAGKGYFYRSEQAWGMPRATIFIVRETVGTIWRLSAVRRLYNEPLRHVEIRSLVAWLAEQQGLDDETLCLPRSPEA